MDESITQDENARAAYLESAAKIGFALCRDAIWDSGACNWMGATVESLDGTARSVYRALSSDIYGGTAGIALFLSHLAQLTGDKVVSRTANGAIRQATTSVQTASSEMQTGFYSGVPGICYAAMMSGRLLDCPEYFEWGLSELKGAAKLTQTSRGLDVVSGIAGVIPLLLAIQPIWDDSVALATELGDRLIKHANRCERGLSWPMSLDSREGSRNLTGFSHGASGIAWALSELFSVVKTAEFGESAQLAVAYENSWFDQTKGNWPDFRSETDPQFAQAWCHGAPGIGLSRVRLFQIHETNKYLEDLRVAIQSIVESFKSSGGMGTYCLCHGHGGNAETLIAAGRELGNSECQAFAHEIARTAIQQYQAQRLPFESGTVGKNPSLLVGDAGVGYWMLRMYTSEVPSILLFDVKKSGKQLCDVNG